MPSACQQRVDAADWDAVAAELNDVGGALLPELITASECAAVLDLYADDGLFRTTVDMGRHRYGQGEYRYFKQPYPTPIDALKQALYLRLLPIARDWWTKLGRDAPWPDTLDEWLEICHRAGQTKSTALMLKYGPGDWNALHRDLYGDLVFPLQVVINLNEPGVAHTGGEFLLVEQRARAQSRGTATTLPRGRGYLFTTRERPIRSTPGLVGSPGAPWRLRGSFRCALHPRFDLSRRGLTRISACGTMVGMELYDVMRSTSAVREFTDDPLPDEVLERILDNARFAPSGGNRQGVRVIVVRDGRVRSALADLSLPAARRYAAQLVNGESPWNPLQPTSVDASTIEATQAPAQMSGSLREAPVVLVICLDLGVVAATDQDLDRIAVVPGASVYPFVWNVLLAARDEGYGGVLTTMVVAEEPRVKDLLGVPDSYAIAAVLPLGKPARQVTKLRRRPVAEFTTRERFDGAPFTR